MILDTLDFFSHRLDLKFQSLCLPANEMKIFKSQVIRTPSRNHDPELSKTVQSRKLRTQIKLRIARTTETKAKRRKNEWGPRGSLELTEYQLFGYFYRSGYFIGHCLIEEQSRGKEASYLRETDRSGSWKTRRTRAFSTETVDREKPPMYLTLRIFLAKYPFGNLLQK